jgi:hypothetical protein
VEVVNDLLPDVHGRAVLVQGALDRLDRALDPRAVPARRREQDALVPRRGVPDHAAMVARPRVTAGHAMLAVPFHPPVG